MNVVLDTNVYISACIQPAGRSGRIVDEGGRGRFSVFLSEAIMAEIETGLRRRRIVPHLRRPPDWIPGFLVDLRQYAGFVKPAAAQAMDEDPDDDVVLGTAVSAAVDYVVSGDAHLLALSSFQGIPILTPRRFLDVLRGIR